MSVEAAKLDKYSSDVTILEDEFTLCYITLHQNVNPYQIIINTKGDHDEF